MRRAVLGTGFELVSRDTASAGEKPACHEPASDVPTEPSGDESSQHSGNSCGRPQLLDSQNLASVKCSLEWMTLEATDSVIAAQIEHLQAMPVIPADSLLSSFSSCHIAVLRI